MDDIVPREDSKSTDQISNPSIIISNPKSVSDQVEEKSQEIVPVEVVKQQKHQSEIKRKTDKRSSIVSYILSPPIENDQFTDECIDSNSIKITTDHSSNPTIDIRSFSYCCPSSVEPNIHSDIDNDTDYRRKSLSSSTANQS